MPKIGVQAMMLKDDVAEKGVYDTLAAAKRVGYRAFEISQIPMTSDHVDEMARAKDELGIEFAALSAALSGPAGSPRESLEQDFDKIVADCERLDARMLRIGILPFDALESLDTVRAFCAAADAMAQRLADRGIRLYYHNHHVEFAKYDGKFLLDIIAEESPHMGLEIDVHWVQRGGLDPATTLRTYADRVAMVHLKDYRIGRMSEDAFAALGRQDYGTFMQEFRHGVVQFAEVGEGNLDFPAIIEASTRIGAEYLLVEQDDLYGRTALECLQTSYDNLVAMGFADLF